MTEKLCGGGAKTYGAQLLAYTMGIMSIHRDELPRRKALALAGSVSAATLMGCGRADGGSHPPTDAGGDAGIEEAGSSASMCTVYPQQVEGPFYLPGDLLRQDITEGKPGTPLTLHLRVVQQGSCVPLTGVAVDVWQCDALGEYSAFPSQLQGSDTSGQRFLRGTQVSDGEGEVQFQTIYPGWYPGRTTHIHFKVRPTFSTAATSQLYFPEALNKQVYTQKPPYKSRGNKDTSNARDGANRQTGIPPMPTIDVAGEGFIARFVIGIAS